MYGKLGGEALQIEKVNIFPISDRFDLTTMKRVSNGDYVKNNEEALIKMKMCGREQKKGESLGDFIDDLIVLIGQGYLGNRAEGVTMAEDRVQFSARSSYV